GEGLRRRGGARARDPPAPTGLARRALYLARPPRRQRTPALEGDAGHARTRRPAQPALHRDAGRCSGASRVARDAAANVARARRRLEGADVMKWKVRLKADAPYEPPRVATWLLRRALPGGVRGDTILGDVTEEWNARSARLSASARKRRASHGETRSTGGARAFQASVTLWYWRQTVLVATRYGWRRERSIEPAASGTRSMQMSLDNLLQDLRYAVRSYVRAPSFTIVVLTTLALGIGASTAIFSMVNGILLQPLPLPDPDRLVYVNETNPKGDFISVSWPNYLDWRARTRSFEALALSRDEPLTLTGGDRAQRVRGRRITANMFTVLRVAPALGRAFTDADDKPDAVPVAIVTDAFWRGQLSADPNVLGRMLRLDGVQHTIVGVMARGFAFPPSNFPRPHVLFVAMGPLSATANLVDRGNHNGFNAVVRLAPGTTVEGAGDELKTLAAALEREYPNTNSGVGARAVRFADQLVSSIRPTLLALFGAVGCLLLIACVNVANLLIARGASRQHEL